MVQLIKQIAMDAVKASKPCDVMVGKVKSINPYEVQIKQNMIIEEEFLLIPKRLKEKLEIGDIVALIRQTRGQLFYILDQI